MIATAGSAINRLIFPQPAQPPAANAPGANPPGAANGNPAAPPPAPKPAPVVAAGAAASAQRATLGSIDPETGYRMMVTLTSRGAAIERLELNSPRYRDIEDRSGYLGHLAATDAPNQGGAVVGLVPPGTPASIAG